MNLMILIRVKYWVKDELFIFVLRLNVWILMICFYIHIFKILHTFILIIKLLADLNISQRIF